MASTNAPELNRNFASAIGADGLPVYAPAYIMVGGRLKLHPTAEDYAEHNPSCWPVEDTPPTDPAPEGYHYEPSGWEDENIRDVMHIIRRVYTLVADPPPPPRRWSRLAIKTALAQAEMLAAARQYLSAAEIATGYTAWEALTDCDYIEEGYPDATKWNALLDGAAQALGRTRAEIDAFLDAIPTEGAL